MPDEKKKKINYPDKQMPQLNRVMAFATYCETLPKGRRHTYATVAKKLGYSVGSIGAIAVKEGWKKRRDDIADLAILKTTETLGEKVAKINEAHFKVFTEMAQMGTDMLMREKEAYYKIIAKYDAGQTIDMKKDRFLAVGRVDVAHRMVVEGIKGQRVALGLPTDVTKSLALNLNATSELPIEDLEKMQTFIDINHNLKLIE